MIYLGHKEDRVYTGISNPARMAAQEQLNCVARSLLNAVEHHGVGACMLAAAKDGMPKIEHVPYSQIFHCGD
jgi:hypothetical protein